MSVHLMSPSGVIVSVSEEKAEMLVLGGYKRFESTGPVDLSSEDEKPRRPRRTKTAE